MMIEMKYIIECTALRSTFVLQTLQLIHVDHTLALLGQEVAIWSSIDGFACLCAPLRA